LEKQGFVEVEGQFTDELILSHQADEDSTDDQEPSCCIRIPCEHERNDLDNHFLDEGGHLELVIFGAEEIMCRQDIGELGLQSQGQQELKDDHQGSDEDEGCFAHSEIAKVSFIDLVDSGDPKWWEKKVKNSGLELKDPPPGADEPRVASEILLWDVDDIREEDVFEDSAQEKESQDSYGVWVCAPVRQEVAGVDQLEKIYNDFKSKGVVFGFIEARVGWQNDLRHELEIFKKEDEDFNPGGVVDLVEGDESNLGFEGRTVLAKGAKGLNIFMLWRHFSDSMQSIVIFNLCEMLTLGF